MLISLIVSAMLAHPADTMLKAACVTAFKERIPLEQMASPVTIIQSDAMTDMGVTHPQGLSAIVPSLLIPEYGASLTSTVYLRGIGSRMENPSMGLYIDGIPVMDKNAYDFDWTMIRTAALMRGPQATLYGRNSMSGTLVLQSFSPDSQMPFNAFVEAGSAGTIRSAVTVSLGRHILTVGVRHRRGWFDNVYKGEKCDPYDGLSIHWKYEPMPSGNIRWSNSLLACISREGGFAYGLYEGGILHPVSYNGEGSNRRISVLDGLNLHYRGERFSLDGTASLQLLSDDMRMDQDFTPEPVFTLRQAQNNCTGTLEVIARGETGSWSRSTGAFAFLRHSSIHAPVTFGRTGIATLILDNANRNIPSDIGSLSIPDDEIMIASDFGIKSIGAAVFHESVFTAGRWRLTAALRLDFEGAQMDYDCMASLHYRFIPTMPVTIDVTIPNVNLSVAQDAIILQCDNVVPLAMGGEYPRYTVTALSGSLKGDELEFSLNFGDYPTSFQGVQTKGTAQIFLPRQLPL
ncbi:MAG: TonB-dependent receptor plug domain-containing protein [Bacteroidales bacterium]|nr:TonB-dependent receptor plug domain-containing protein [Bacteroidales bacterium]